MERALTTNGPTDAQRPAGKTPEVERLNAFVGKWRTEGQTAPDGKTPSAKILSSDIYEWVPGGFFVLHYWEGHVGDAEVGGIEIIGRDPDSRAYRTHFFDNAGNSGSEQLTVDDRSWTWLGQNVMGAKWHRCRSLLSDDGQTMTARHERSNDGRDWTPWMDVTLQRLG